MEKAKRRKGLPNYSGLLGPFVAAADALGLPAWLGRRDWFTDTDSHLQELQAKAVARGGALPMILGISPGSTAIETLRELLWVAGHKLEVTQTTDGPTAYRVVEEPLPAGVDRARLEAKWMEELRTPLLEVDEDY